MFLAPHILDWIYSEGFDEVTIPNVVPETILDGVAVLESANENGSTCKNNGRVVIMWWTGNYLQFLCNEEIIILLTAKILLVTAKFALGFYCYSYIYSPKNLFDYLC